MPSLVSMVGPVVVVLADALATSLAFVDAAGAVAEEPDGNAHCASVTPHSPLPVVAPVSPRLAVAWLPESWVSMNRFPEAFRYVPVVGLAGTATFTVIVQVPLAAIVPFEKAIEAAPAENAPAPMGATSVGLPQPVMDVVVFAIVMAPGEVGKVSLKDKPPIGLEVGLLIVNVRAEVLPATMEAGENALEIPRLTMEAVREELEKSLL